jgi:hypothetical protein
LPAARARVVWRAPRRRSASVSAASPHIAALAAGFSALLACVPAAYDVIRILELRDRVDLIELPLNDRPQSTGDTPGGLAVAAVPDVAGGVVGKCADHSLVSRNHGS